ncbi:uncharacterized protein PHALS_08083 [Plasmopara halstedii]|uniref:Uncharacterized protein n=1 Tax=Plasmopara halstedii TaxID=4781 RepID=A0A0N7L8N5_PLAHL|nr:uncharacterized protein PHALS_08083 [Plasmopara halstedii]CEG50371.1 hypothetical protein PHALS_08083 [Plasmopara halstedii]|eukprot:XP_024586740.1 hypothetical protein PHALS_08083 [Plasmopara halstedii]
MACDASIPIEQTPNITKLYPKHCLKDNRRSAYRINQERIRSARDIRSSGSIRRPYHSARKLNGAPDKISGTDCGPDKTLQRKIASRSDKCRGALNSSKTTAYRSYTFASGKEPYAHPQAVSTGRYHESQCALSENTQQVSTSAYFDKVARFEQANAQVSAVLTSDRSNSLKKEITISGVADSDMCSQQRHASSRKRFQV